MQALGIASGGLGPARDPDALSRLHSFTSPIPDGQFILLDMSAHGDGEYKQWHGQWQVPFIWTALHTCEFRLLSSIPCGAVQACSGRCLSE